MLIKQISVFVENKPGRLYHLVKTMADQGIDLKALSIADTEKFGILRCIVNDPESALKIIKDANFTASMTDVLALEVTDQPGGLAEALGILMEAGIDVDYVYSFVRTRSENALIILKVEENEKAVDALKSSGMKVLSGSDVSSL